MTKDWSVTADKIIKKEREAVKRNAGRIPYTTESPHVFDDQNTPERITWWTNGFWGGMMWQLYHASGDETFREAALFVEEQMDRVLMSYQGMDHDSGFRFLPTAVAHYRLEKDPKARNRALLAAENLAGRFNRNGNFIRAWNDWGDGRDTRGWAIIDCMMNLPLLYWASEELQDPRFYSIAVAHAETAMEYFIRENGSVRHIVAFDPESGECVGEHGGQGVGDGSSWTRGQAWAIYGFSLSYRYTKDDRFLKTAVQVAERFLEKMPKDGLMPSDFDQPQGCPVHDSAASAIASCGLLTLSELLGSRENPDAEEKRQAEQFREAALQLLSILDGMDCDYDPTHDELLGQCTAAFHDPEHNFPMIYADYFYIEALWKLTGKEFFIW